MNLEQILRLGFTAAVWVGDTRGPKYAHYADLGVGVRYDDDGIVTAIIVAKFDRN